MFQAVREWWKSERVRKVSRLFAFELSVVMIGVLAAQEVSSWAQRRSEINEVEGFHDDLLHSYEVYRRIAKSNQVAAPCYNERIDRILKAVAKGGEVDQALLLPAKLPGMSPDNMSPQLIQLLRERYGDEETDRLESVQFNLRTNDEAARAIDSLWYQFQRLDTRHGAVSDGDRSAARDAAVRIKANLAALDASAGRIVKLTDLLGIRPKPGAKLGPVGSCDEIWRSGRAYRGD